MNIAVVTGSSGLIGGESVEFFTKKFDLVIGIDNNLRSYFFGADGSTIWNKNRLEEKYPNFKSYDIDIRDYAGLEKVFNEFGSDIKLIVHAAAQPSHDWAAKEPLTDFGVNATGTLNMLELTRLYCAEAVFIFTSTNKVYGDTPNFLPLVELDKRWEIAEDHAFFKHGIDEPMSIDQTKHSVFGAGFLAYLMKCAISGTHYTIFGYQGKQVRDNIHSADLVNMFWHFYQSPKMGEVYNAGGGRFANCSMLEAIDWCEKISGKKMSYSYSETNRIGDHIWYVSDVNKFKSHYPTWNWQYDLEATLVEMHDRMNERMIVKDC